MAQRDRYRETETGKDREERDGKKRETATEYKVQIV